MEGMWPATMVSSDNRDRRKAFKFSNQNKSREGFGRKEKGL